MKFLATGIASLRNQKRFLLLAFFLLCTLELHATPIKFVQVTDLHLYDKDESEGNKTALRDCIQKINELSAGGEHYEFVVVTGDIGIEGLLKDLYKQKQDLESKTKLPNGSASASLPAQPSTEMVKIQSDLATLKLAINNKIVSSAMEVADILSHSDVLTWLFLPGNNDLIDEQTETIDLYERFIDQLANQLRNKITIKDLTRRGQGPYTEGSNVFVGLNNASFKNNDDPRRITDKELNQLTQQEVADKISLTGASLTLTKVGQQQQGYVADVSAVVDQSPTSNVYILFHIPEVDDPHPVLNFDTVAVNNRRLALSDTYSVSAWFIEGEVRRQWHDVVNKPQVKGLFAGHLHDWRYQSYENYDWLRTPATLYGAVIKLHICPPLAIKRQSTTANQARGFQVVSLNDTEIASVQKWWHYDTTRTFSTIAPGAKVETEEDVVKFLEQFVALIGHLAWPLIALIVLFLFRVQLVQIVQAIASRVADPSSDLTVGEISIKTNLAANAGNLESLDMRLQVLEGLIDPRTAVPAGVPVESDEQKLSQLADEYMAVSIPDYGARVRRKDQLATEMGNFIVRQQMSREWVSDQENEGFKVGLASAINAVPKEGDLALLLKIGNSVTRLHVKYRIAVALGRLFESGIATKADTPDANSMLTKFREGADASLERRIVQTQSIINLTGPNTRSAP